MSRSTLHFISWVLAVTGVLLWIAVPLFVFQISTLKSTHDAAMKNEEVLSQNTSATVKTHALLESTAASRGEIIRKLDLDVVSIVDIIEAAGKASNVSAEVSNAVAESSTKSQPVTAFSFVVQAHGDFSSLMRMAGLLQTLPLISSLDEISITKESEDSTWKLGARVRVLTTAPLSS